MKTNQYGFTPQNGTIDAVMEVKHFVIEGLAAGEVIVLVSLDVRDAFDAAWWTSILNSLRGCVVSTPQNYIKFTNAHHLAYVPILYFKTAGVLTKLNRHNSQARKLIRHFIRLVK